MARQPGDQSDQRRLVNVSPGKVLAAGHVIKLVPKKAVVVDARKLDGDFGNRQPPKSQGVRRGLRSGQSQRQAIDLAKRWF